MNLGVSRFQMCLSQPGPLRHSTCLGSTYHSILAVCLQFAGKAATQHLLSEQQRVSLALCVTQLARAVLTTQYWQTI